MFLDGTAFEEIFLKNICIIIYLLFAFFFVLIKKIYYLYLPEIKVNWCASGAIFHQYTSLNLFNREI